MDIVYVLIKSYGYGEMTVHGVSSRIDFAEMWKNADSVGNNDYITCRMEDISGFPLIPNRRLS